MMCGGTEALGAVMMMVDGSATIQYCEREQEVTNGDEQQRVGARSLTKDWRRTPHRCCVA
eukprot:scaffold1001_cov169-Amphora_coffeaeformis.AAC.34